MKARKRVLVCDGDPQGVRALQVVLRGAGFQVHATHSAEEALDQAALLVPDAVIIELSLPDGNGADVCRELREWCSAPLIVLSSVTDEAQKVLALAAGADDYVTKPFGPRELIARLRAHLRRATARSDQPVVETHGLQLDLAARVVWRDEEQIRLTPIEYRLLRTLLANRGRLMTHGELLQQAWGAAYTENRQTLRAHMANLRGKLASTGPHPLIRTYPGAGYLFANCDERCSAGPQAAVTARVAPLTAV
jgi:two-component system KDP operon response regulator KdpE